MNKFDMVSISFNNFAVWFQYEFQFSLKFQVQSWSFRLVLVTRSMVGNRLRVAAWVRLMVTGQSRLRASGNIGRNPMD